MGDPLGAHPDFARPRAGLRHRYGPPPGGKERRAALGGSRGRGWRSSRRGRKGRRGWRPHPRRRRLAGPSRRSDHVRAPKRCSTFGRAARLRPCAPHPRATATPSHPCPIEGPLQRSWTPSPWGCGGGLRLTRLVACRSAASMDGLSGRSEEAVRRRGVTRPRAGRSALVQERVFRGVWRADVAETAADREGPEWPKKM